MKKVFRKQISYTVFISISLAIIAFSALGSWAVPNLDGDSQPNRMKLSECIADVQQVMSKDYGRLETQQAATAICNARKAHAKQKARFINNLNKLQKQFQGRTNYGYDKHVKVATQDAWNIVKSCVSFKEGFTNPHNIAVFGVPNEIRSACYSMGASLVEAQLEDK